MPDRNAVADWRQLMLADYLLSLGLGLIRQAQRPVIVVSNGIRYAQAWTELLQFAEGYTIPVITTYSGKGVFPEDHPLALGCQGRNGSIPAVRAAQESDRVIAIGTRFSDFDTGAWTVYNIPRQTRLIHIDIDIGEIARVYPPEVGIVAITQLIDTTTATGKLLLGVLAAVAEFARSLIRERTQDGLARARAEGKWLGRPPGKKDTKRCKNRGTSGDGLAQGTKLPLHQCKNPDVFTPMPRAARSPQGAGVATPLAV